MPAPQARGREVVVRVERCGVCHTDLHLHDGAFDLGGGNRLALKQSLPLPWIGCGDCGLCASDREHLCGRARAIGVNVDGGYAEFVHVVDARYVLPIGDVDPDQAALLMCSGLSAYSALTKVAAAFEAGLPVAIIGFGGLGLMALEIARARFGRVPAVLDVDDTKLALARERGAEAFDLGDPDAHKAVRAALGAVGAVIDFVGAEATSAAAGRLCGQAGHIVNVGLYGGLLTTPLPLLTLRGTTIQGSYTGSVDEARACLALAARGALDAIPVEHCTRGALNDAFGRLRRGEVSGRIIVQ